MDTKHTSGPVVPMEPDIEHRIAYAIQQNYLHELAAYSLEQIKVVVADVIDDEDDALTAAYLHGFSKGKASAPEPVVLTDEQIDAALSDEFLGYNGDDPTLPSLRGLLRRAYRAAASRPAPVKAQAVPEGWKLVPCKTTEAMREAFKRAYRDGNFWGERIDRALDEMLAAATAPSNGEA